MSYWLELPNSDIFPLPGEMVRFQRGSELSEPVRVSHVDPSTKTVYFTDTIPHGIREGDSMVGLPKRVGLF